MAEVPGGAFLPFLRSGGGHGFRFADFRCQFIQSGADFRRFQGFRVVRAFPVHGGGQGLPGADQFIHSHFSGQLRDYVDVVAANAPGQQAAGRAGRDTVRERLDGLRADMGARARA